MTDRSATRSILEVSAPLEHYLIAVPKCGDGVCAVCHSAVYKGYRTCYPCNDARRTLGGLCLDAVAFVSLAPVGNQLARDLYSYKRSNVPERLRRELTVGLSAVLWRWLSRHEQCLAVAAGSDGFDMVTTVPSTSGRGADHPLRILVGGIVAGTRERTRDVLSLYRADVTQRKQAADRFVATEDVKGRSVLVVDDTWTTGAHIQSASAALKQAGAAKVAGVAIGRWFRTDYQDNAAWLKRVRPSRWSWDNCCL